LPEKDSQSQGDQTKLENKNLIATDLKKNTAMHKFMISFEGFEPTIQIISITLEPTATI
jgi:hypothetical protein